MLICAVRSSITISSLWFDHKQGKQPVADASLPSIISSSALLSIWMISRS